MITIPGKIPVRIHPFFWLLVLAIGWINSGNPIGMALWAIVIFVSVLIHEYGHALTAVFFGQKTQIDLVGFGGLTSRSGKRIKLWQEFLIVLNGPLAGLILALLAYPFFSHITYDSIQIWEYLAYITFTVNLFWTLLNLLPIYPLDGGHLLRIILEGAFGIKGVKFALFFSMLLAGGIALLAFALGWILLGAIMFLFAFDSYRQWNESRKMSPKDKDEGLQDLFIDVEKALRRGDKPLAEQKLWEIYNNSDLGVLHYTAAVYLANILSASGRYSEAYSILEKEKGILEEDVLPLFLQVAWKTGHVNEAAEYSNDAYQAKPSYQTALTNAFIFASKREVTAAVGWLKRAISDGLPEPKNILNHHDFHIIRHEPEFQQLVQRY